AHASVVITQPVKINYFALSYKKALIELSGAHFVNPQFVSGQQYMALWDGVIHTGGSMIPGTIAGTAFIPGHPGAEGKVWGVDTVLPRELDDLRQEVADLQQELARLRQENVRLRQENMRLRRENVRLRQENVRLNDDLLETLDSASWRITAPLREVLRWI